MSYLSTRANIPGTLSTLTYFRALPKELYRLLAIYYFGPIEMNIKNLSDNTDISEVMVTVDMKFFTPDGNWQTNEIITSFSLDNLRYLMSNRSTETYFYDDHPLHIVSFNKRNPELFISIMATGAVQNYTTAHLNSYYTTLFYEKLQLVLEKACFTIDISDPTLSDDVF